ncbi:MAG TPA: hypothetical protein VK171_03265 [Fimbriimonas sp.]|nr:hypothetical protein [Fimbriimonas sp.]
MKNSTKLTLALATLFAVQVAPIATATPLLVSTMLLTQAEDAAPRYVSATITTVNFGSTASIKVKTDEGVEATYIVNDSSKMTIAGAAANLTTVYQKLNGQKAKFLIRKVASGFSVVNVWDDASWTSYLNLHNDVQMGAFKEMSGRILVLGDKAYKIDDNTVFMKGGKKVGRKKMEGLTQMWIKGDISSGYPVAKIIGDTTDSVGGVASSGSGNNRPASGQNKRPASTGSSTTYYVTLSFKIIDSSDTEGGDLGEGVAKGYGVADKQVECFGSLNFNGKNWWKIVEKDATKNRKGENEVLAVVPKTGAAYGSNGRFVVKESNLMLSGSLNDWDLATKFDQLMKVNLNLDLAQIANKGVQVYRTQDGKAQLQVNVVSQ